MTAQAELYQGIGFTIDKPKDWHVQKIKRKVGGQFIFSKEKDLNSSQVFLLLKVDRIKPEYMKDKTKDFFLQVIAGRTIERQFKHWEKSKKINKSGNKDDKIAIVKTEFVNILGRKDRHFFLEIPHNNGVMIKEIYFCLNKNNHLLVAEIVYPKGKSSVAAKMTRMLKSIRLKE